MHIHARQSHPDHSTVSAYRLTLDEALCFGNRKLPCQRRTSTSNGKRMASEKRDESVNPARLFAVRPSRINSSDIDPTAQVRTVTTRHFSLSSFFIEPSLLYRHSLDFTAAFHSTSWASIQCTRRRVGSHHHVFPLNHPFKHLSIIPDACSSSSSMYLRATIWTCRGIPSTCSGESITPVSRLISSTLIHFQLNSQGWTESSAAKSAVSTFLSAFKYGTTTAGYCSSSSASSGDKAPCFDLPRECSILPYTAALRKYHVL